MWFDDLMLIAEEFARRRQAKSIQVDTGPPVNSLSAFEVLFTEQATRSRGKKGRVQGGGDIGIFRKPGGATA